MSSNIANMTDIDRCPCMKVNLPEFFKREDFLNWLNNENDRIMTWHRRGTDPDEYSDVVVTYDSGEGSNSDMPKECWKELCKLWRMRMQGDYGLIWVTNLE